MAVMKEPERHADAVELSPTPQMAVREARPEKTAPVGSSYTPLETIEVPSPRLRSGRSSADAVAVAAPAAADPTISPEVERDRKADDERPATGVRFLPAAALLAVIFVASYCAHRGPQPNTEESYPNWQYVEQANRANDAKFKAARVAQAGLERVERGQSLGEVGGIGVSSWDIDAAVTSSVRDAVQSGNAQQIQSAMKSAVQNVPALPSYVKDEQGQPLVQAPPVLTPAIARQISTGEAQFCRVFLYDSCAEDGDTVQVMVDGEPYVVVPLTVAGTSILIPVSAEAPTSIAIKGIYDGGGGITVGARTSEGDFFSRAMYVGETEELTIGMK